MEKFYTAVGRTQIRTNQRGNQNPVVICNEKEYILDLPEMILWSVLNWHIVTADEARVLYESKANELDCSSELAFYTYLQRLLQRGLIAEGNGDTPADALYSLLLESKNLLDEKCEFDVEIFEPYSDIEMEFGLINNSEKEAEYVIFYIFLPIRIYNSNTRERYTVGIPLCVDVLLKIGDNVTNPFTNEMILWEDFLAI